MTPGYLRQHSTLTLGLFCLCLALVAVLIWLVIRDNKGGGGHDGGKDDGGKDDGSGVHRIVWWDDAHPINVGPQNPCYCDDGCTYISRDITTGKETVVDEGCGMAAERYRDYARNHEGQLGRAYAIHNQWAGIAPG